MRLLLIEDEENIAKPLKKNLENRGFAVDHAADGKEGFELADLNQYDCILLDLNLPGMDGVELSRKLRQKKNTTPIIMVTARSQILQKLEGFDHGADDYVTKPFNIQELTARIHAVIKRNSVNKSDILKAGELELHPDSNTVSIARGKTRIEVELTTKETGVLEYLIRNQGKIISAEQLLEHVWDRETDIFSDTVKTHIKTLRKKIDPEKKIITTVRGKGYRIKD
jgi:two-component system, OmpR family, response regulator